MKLNSVQTKLLLSLIMIFVVFISINYIQYTSFLSGNYIFSTEYRFLFVAFVFSATLGTVIFVLDRTISYPIKKIVKTTDAAREGNLSASVELDSKDELGYLAYSINELILKLKKAGEKVQSLENYSKDMDKIVYNRTQELNTKIEDLTKMKTAILNMMEDADDTNIKLLVSQEKLKKSLSELKELDVRKDQFISVAAHELKTPITAIRGFSDLLQGRLASDEKARNKYLNIINVEIKRLGKLVDDILDLSRIDIGKIRLIIDNTDIYELIERLKGMTNAEVKKRGLDYIFEIEEGLPVIMSDKERLEQVLINLVGNALKFTDKGSIKVSARREGNKVIFSVKDSGVGIPEDDLEKIFERFYQVESHLTRKAGGAGLGLSICMEIVKLMNGKIWAESEVGKGTTMHVLLPIEQPGVRASELKEKATVGI